MLFSNEWFKKYQNILLWFLNTPVILLWFRWILRINGNRSSVGRRKIIRIYPYAIVWKKSTYSKFYQIECRTHNKFSKRLFYAFYLLWLIFHVWDTIFANNFAPSYNLGFDTLTAFPDPDTETTSVDGETRRTPGSSEAWATIRPGAGTAAADSLATGRIFISSTGTDAFDFFWRIMALFDTSTLTSSASISAAVLSFVSNSVTNNYTDSTAVSSSSPASNTSLVAADHNIANLGSTSFGALANASINTDGTTYNDITFNSDGKSAISKTAISKFALRFLGDITNTPYAGGLATGNNVTMFLADNTGTSKDPKLVVTYTLLLPNIKTLKGLAKGSVKTMNGLAIGSVKSINGLS